MKSLKLLIFFVVTAANLTSCGVQKYATISNTPDLSKYKYVYISPTQEKTSVSGGTFGNQYGVYGLTTSKSINPSDIIAGGFMKHGFIVVPELAANQKAQTIVVSYGESGRRNRFIDYAIEVTIQFLDAATNELICVTTAEGTGDTEADDIRNATLKCLDALFK